MTDIVLVSTRSSFQGRLGTHMFDIVLPPLGLAYLGAVLEKAGRSVGILDAFAQGIDDEALVERLAGGSRIVGFYCNTENVRSIGRIAGRLKACQDPPLVILGGPHASALPEETMAAIPAVDAVVFGEGEATACELVDRLLQGRSLRDVRGAAFREDGRVVKNPPRELIQDLDALPMPAWHLLPMDKYRSFVEARGRRVMHLMTSRGCFSDCHFCQSTKLWGSKVRYHSPERVLREVDLLRREHGIEFIQFSDDIFTHDPRRVKVLSRALRERRIAWTCTTRIDLLDDGVVADLKAGGADFISIGIETVNTRLLQTINKHMTREKVLAALELCRRRGLKVEGLFILGLPTETREEALETLEFAGAWPFHLVIYSFFTAYPGTNYWAMLKDSPHLDKDFSRYSLATGITYVEPPRTAREIEALMTKGYLDFYLRPRNALTLLGLVLRNPGQLLSSARGFLSVLANLLRSRSRSCGPRAGRP